MDGPAPTLTLDELRSTRSEIQSILNSLDQHQGSRYLSLAKTELEMSRMWLGKAMGEAGGEDLNAKRDAELA